MNRGRTAIALALVAVVTLAVAVVLASVVFDRSDSKERPFTVSLEPVASGFERPIFLTGTADGSGDLYVIEQAGVIHRMTADGLVLAPPVLDISERVLLQHERGLLGFALHPEFETDPRFFVAYSREGEGATVLSEFTVSALLDPEDDEAEPAPPIEASERTLLTIPQPFTTHKAGMLVFDEAGMLLMGVGDGGHQDDPFDNGLDPTSLLAKLLRFDIDSGWPYGIPHDNGFRDAPGARDEVHAIGLRNPWRFSFDHKTGDLFIADVGQREWEEINVYPRGLTGVSFGWSDMEGAGCLDDRECEPADHVGPAIAYRHVDGDLRHCAVVGGYVYRGSAHPLLEGDYLYADFCSGTIWAADAEAMLAGDAEPAVVGRLPEAFGQPYSFGEDDAGELYLVTSEGDVLRIGMEDPGSESA